jgi:hypothetical protein
MTNDEYAFMTDREWDAKDQKAFYQASVDCYENGWIDNFGLITPKGQKAIEEFERG